ncbi:MAG: biosynthetic-type acetolactate synthase large subunit [Firmicutes bacterium]|nr:biosynthetic-type acetolactate synthase large subunit [Bacillota bacterium]
MKMKGAQIVVNCLIEQGVDVVFGYPGGQIIDVYDALYEYSDKITHILSSHEQGAAHAADGYARSTGKVGVVISTSGPGATNLVTGLATAYMDSVPMVAICGNVGLQLLGKDSFQEVDTTGITVPITKYNFIVKDEKDVAKTLRRAFYIAQEGRPGPVVVDILKNAQIGIADYEYEAPKEIIRSTDKLLQEDVDNAAELIKNAERPVIFAGGGIIIANASSELCEFAEKIGAPVALSMMGLGAYPADKPYYMGMLGMHGTRVSSKALSESDLIILAGTRLSDRVVGKKTEFATHAPVIHLDVDPAEINKNIASDASVIGDLKVVLKKLTDALPKGDRSQWLAKIAEWKKQWPPVKENKGEITPYHLISEVAKIMPEDAIVTTDVGQHQVWTAQHYPFKLPRTFLSSGGLGTMGYGLGAAIGAKVGNPGRKVVMFTGDGSFHMNMNELATAATYDLDILIVVLNNGVLGMVRQWQKLMYNQHYSQTTLHRKTDYVKLADAFGGKGFNVTTKAELAEVLEKVKDMKGFVILNVAIDKDVNVLPMVPPGNAYNQQVFEIEV